MPHLEERASGRYVNSAYLALSIPVRVEADFEPYALTVQRRGRELLAVSPSSLLMD